jgi:hypothetical protein
MARSAPPVRSDEIQSAKVQQPLSPVTFIEGGAVGVRALAPQSPAAVLARLESLRSKVTAFHRIKLEEREKPSRLRPAAPGPGAAAPTVPSVTGETKVQEVAPGSAPPAGTKFTLESRPIQTGFGVTGWAEPSVAVAPASPALGNNDIILLTYNIQAALSTDGGTTLRILDLTDLFQDAQRGEGDNTFYGDQIVQYIPPKGGAPGMMIWIMQQHLNTNPPTTPSQRLRLAVWTDNELKTWVDSNLSNRPKAYEFDPGFFGFTNSWFDFPDIAVTDKFLCLTCDVFDQRSPFPGVGSILARFPLDTLRQKGQINPNDPETVRFFRFMLNDPDPRKQLSHLRLTRGASDTMGMATHSNIRKPSGEIAPALFVIHWKDSDPGAAFEVVEVDPWFSGPTSFVMGQTAQGGAALLNWLQFNDGRITAGWFDQKRKEAGFAWTAAGQSTQIPNPHIRIARIDATDFKTMKGQAQIWSQSFAYAFPSIAVDTANNGGELGVAVMYGGNATTSPNVFPSFAAGLYDPDSTSGDSPFSLVQAAAGQGAVANMNDPNTGQAIFRAGDYVTVGPDSRTNGAFVAAGYVPLALSSTSPPTQVQYVQLRKTGSGPAGPLAAAAPAAPLAPPGEIPPALRETIRQIVREEIKKATEKP